MSEDKPIRCAAWCSQYPDCQHDWRTWNEYADRLRSLQAGGDTPG